jgi:hypothetical protein
VDPVLYRISLTPKTGYHQGRTDIILMNQLLGYCPQQDLEKTCEVLRYIRALSEEISETTPLSPTSQPVGSGHIYYQGTETMIATISDLHNTLQTYWKNLEIIKNNNISLKQTTNKTKTNK